MELLVFAELTPIYGQTIQFFDSVFSFFATLICVIVLFTVGNTMSMAVVEHNRASKLSLTLDGSALNDQGWDALRDVLTHGATLPYLQYRQWQQN